MQFKAILIPRVGEKFDQVFCSDLEQAKKWARRILWDRHRKLVQSIGPGAGVTSEPYKGPQVLITKIETVTIAQVYPWDVTDADKSMEGGPE